MIQRSLAHSLKLLTYLDEVHVDAVAQKFGTGLSVVLEVRKGNVLTLGQIAEIFQVIEHHLGKNQDPLIEIGKSCIAISDLKMPPIGLVTSFFYCGAY